MHQSGRNASELVEIDPFTQAFYEIDTDSDGVITRADLENFVRRNDIEDGTLVRSWMKLFEPSEGDFITMKVYQEKLGLLEDDKVEITLCLLKHHINHIAGPRVYSEVNTVALSGSPICSTPSLSLGSPETQTYSGLKNPEIRIISASMSAERQSEIIDQICRLVSANKSCSKFNEAQTVADLKRWLESRFGRVWHVILIRGAYWMHYSHEIDCSLQFQLGSYVYLLWRTPAG
ncbi:Tegument antigen [Taenia solium]|eukprot:TsM_000839500 transcript=TsM_000839500 gene=TsM_000839500